MQKYPINFRSMNDVTEFVKIVNRFDCDMDLCRGSVIIDAKSFLGVMTISEAPDLELVIHDNECDPIVSLIGSFIREQKTA